MRITRRFNDNLTKLNGTKYNSVENLPSNLCNSWMPDPEKTSQNRGGAAPRIPGESVPESWMSCWGIVTREESSRFVSYCQLMGTVIASNFIELRWGGMGNGRNGEREEWGTGGWRRPKTETPTAGCIAVTTERSTRIPNHMICVSFPTFEAKSVLLIWIRHDWFQRIDRRWRHWRRHWRFLELGKFASRRDYSKMVGFQMEAHSLTGKPDQYSKGCLK